jgi:BolA family transcriptional regulator, general stress-responsive regulator
MIRICTRVMRDITPLAKLIFSVRIVSPVFSGMSAVARQGEIYRVLADELRERVHALSLQALSPEENTSK